MADVQRASEGIFALPNEILLNVFDHFSSRALIQFTPTCRHFHTLALLVLHNRLQIAAGLDGHALYFRCHHPSADLRASKFFCHALATDGLSDLLTTIYDEENYLGQVKSLFGLYSRFRPQIREPSVKVVYNPMTGSRSYSDFNASSSRDPNERVVETVTVDAHDLFSQLSTAAHLGKREPDRGILVSMHVVSQGVVRVWREWLGKHCESRTWTDGEPVVVQGVAPTESGERNPLSATSIPECPNPTKDPCILWLADQNLGVRIKVKEKQWRANLNTFSSDAEVPVSYLVEFEEVLVRTSHLLLQLEEAQKCLESGSGKAIVFGSFRG